MSYFCDPFKNTNRMLALCTLWVVCPGVETCGRRADTTILAPTRGRTFLQESLIGDSSRKVTAQ